MTLLHLEKNRLILIQIPITTQVIMNQLLFHQHQNLSHVHKHVTKHCSDLVSINHQEAMTTFNLLSTFQVRKTAAIRLHHNLVNNHDNLPIPPSRYLLLIEHVVTIPLDIKPNLSSSQIMESYVLLNEDEHEVDHTASQNIPLINTNLQPQCGQQDLDTNSDENYYLIENNPPPSSVGANSLR